MSHVSMVTFRHRAGGYAPQTPLYCSDWGKGYPQGRSWNHQNFQNISQHLKWSISLISSFEGEETQKHPLSFIDSLSFIVIPSLWVLGWDVDSELYEWVPFLHPKRRLWRKRRKWRKCHLSIVNVVKCNLEAVDDHFVVTNMCKHYVPKGTAVMR